MRETRGYRLANALGQTTDQVAIGARSLCRARELAQEEWVAAAARHRRLDQRRGRSDRQPGLEERRNLRATQPGQLDALKRAVSVQLSERAGQGVVTGDRLAAIEQREQQCAIADATREVLQEQGCGGIWPNASHRE
jgi:hypothetical protein